MKIKATLATMLGMTLAIAGATTAEAAPPTECISSSYSCTTNGYEGEDTYNYHFSSKLDAWGRKHNCTAYAAYQIGLFTFRNPDYGNLGNADEWAANALRFKLNVSTTPHWRDIAFWSSKGGHVAFVEDVVYFASGRVAYIVITEDNAGVEHPERRLTKRRVLYPSDASYPEKFITFPAIIAGGGRPPVAYKQPLL
jgi:surface antigen